MTDTITTMTDIEIHNEIAERLDNPSFDQEVDALYQANRLKFKNRLECERLFKRQLANSRARLLEPILRKLRSGVPPIAVKQELAEVRRRAGV